MSNNDYNEFGFPVCTDEGSKKDFDSVAVAVEEDCNAMGNECGCPSTGEENTEPTAELDSNKDEHAMNLGIG